MSYSYVKTVFPDFKYSNVYDTKLYDNLNTSKRDDLIEPIESQTYYTFNNNTNPVQSLQNVQNAQNLRNIPNAENVLNKSIQNFVNFKEPNTPNILNTPTAKNVSNNSFQEFVNLETFQDNQKIYHPPIPMNNIQLNNNIIKKENFNTNTNTNTNANDHLQYTTHVLDCPICKEILIKQLGLENQRILTTEIMELISYIIFGLFIILLIDTYAK
jgi:hypothetical protein